MGQRLLLLLFIKKNLPKIDNWTHLMIKITIKKTLVKVTMSKSTCPKWHFGQIGQELSGVSLDQFFKSKKS
jgi:hypothetical protein